MAHISNAWLVGLVVGERRGQRNHGANLDAIKAHFEREFAFLNQTATAIASAALSLATALLLAVYSDVSNAHVIGSTSVINGQTTEVSNHLASTPFDEPDRLALRAAGVLAAISLVSIILNRILHQRLQQGYLRIIYTYYTLNRVIF